MSDGLVIAVVAVGALVVLPGLFGGSDTGIALGATNPGDTPRSDTMAPTGSPMGANPGPGTSAAGNGGGSGQVANSQPGTSTTVGGTTIVGGTYDPTGNGGQGTIVVPARESGNLANDVKKVPVPTVSDRKATAGINPNAPPTIRGFDTSSQPAPIAPAKSTSPTGTVHTVVVPSVSYSPVVSGRRSVS